jgi:hypothetical protein
LGYGPPPSAKAPPRLRTPEDRRLKPVAGSPLLLWRGEDSNLRRHTPADLQSAPFGRLGTSPHRFSPRISFRRALELPCSTSPGAGLNRRPRPYQGRALPTELPGHSASADRGASRRVLALRSSAYRKYASVAPRCARDDLPRAPRSQAPGQSSRAGDGNRTRDVQLGRLMLYQLSYSRDMRSADRVAPRRLLAQRSSPYRGEHGRVPLRWACEDLSHARRSTSLVSFASSGESRRPESNRRPADYKSAALPSELRRPAGSSPANVVVCGSIGFRLRHPCYGRRLSPVRCLSCGAEADLFRAGDQLVPTRGGA